MTVINTRARCGVSSEGLVTFGEQYLRTCRNQIQKAGVSTPWKVGSLLWEGGLTQRGSLGREHGEIAVHLDPCSHQGR